MFFAQLVLTGWGPAAFLTSLLFGGQKESRGIPLGQKAPRGLSGRRHPIPGAVDGASLRGPSL